MTKKIDDLNKKLEAFEKVNKTNLKYNENNSSYGFTMTVIGAVGSGGNTSMWKFEGLIKRGANAAATAIVGNVVKNRIAYDSGASAWDVAVTANASQGSLVVTVTGQASTTIRWIANIETTELTYS